MNCQTCPRTCQFLTCSKTPYRQVITAKTHNSIEMIPADQILYFHAKHKYIEVHHLKGMVNISDSLHDLITEFDSIAIQVHRSYIVMMNKIERIMLDWSQRGHNRRHYAGLTTGEQIPISRRSTVAVKARLKAQAKEIE